MRILDVSPGGILLLVVSKQEATEGCVFLFLLCVWSVYFTTNFDVFLYAPYTLSCMYYADTFCIKSSQNGTNIQNSHEFVDQFQDYLDTLMIVYIINQYKIINKE
jgi:hypothetical protein